MIIYHHNITIKYALNLKITTSTWQRQGGLKPGGSGRQSVALPSEQYNLIVNKCHFQPSIAYRLIIWDN